MSINLSPSVDVSLSNLKTDPTIDVEASSVSPIKSKSLQEIEVVRKEYSIVGDKFYIGTNSGQLPLWLDNLLEASISSSVNNAMSDYNLLVQDVRNAIDAIDVAANTYVEEITFNDRVDSIVGSHLTTLNASLDGKFATIVDLSTVSASIDTVSATKVSDLRAELVGENGPILSRVTTVENSVATYSNAYADSITALTNSFTNQENTLAGNSEAIESLNTYIGITSEGQPTGFGVLSRISTLENQADGIVDITSDVYDVMEGVEDPNTDSSNDLMRFDALPYVLWTNMTGTGSPTATTRNYTHYGDGDPYTSSIGILEGTFYTRSDFTDKDVDKYYKFDGSSWNAVTESVFTDEYDNLRSLHIGDVYIHYTLNGEDREYVRSYRFVKTTIDENSPLSTDSDGYTWQLIQDEATKIMYETALKARAMADGKISQFYAWSDSDSANKYPEDFSFETDEGLENVDSSLVKYWFREQDRTLYEKDGPDWTSTKPVPTDVGDGVYISEGDILTVYSPIDRDLSVYRYNGSVWDMQTPNGIISKSRWAIDLANDVRNPNGHVASAISTLKNETETTATNDRIAAQSLFSYNTTLTLDGQSYSTGFGLQTDAEQMLIRDIGNQPVFSSEFWINSDTLVFRSASTPTAYAQFSVTPNGSLVLGTSHTEATRNVVSESYDNAETYNRGDIITLYEGSSWVCLVDGTTGVTPGSNDLVWVSTGSARKGVSNYTIRVDSWFIPGQGQTLVEWFDDVVADAVGNGLANNDVFTVISTVDTTDQVTYINNNGTWEPFALDIHGNQLVRGTVVADSLVADAIVANVSIKLGSTGDEKFTVDINGNMKAKDAVLESVLIKDSEGNVILSANGIEENYLKDLVTPSVIAGKVFASDLQGDINASMFISVNNTEYKYFLDHQYDYAGVGLAEEDFSKHLYNYYYNGVTPLDVDKIFPHGVGPHSCISVVDGSVDNGHGYKSSPAVFSVAVGDSGIDNGSRQRLFRCSDILWRGVGVYCNVRVTVLGSGIHYVIGNIKNNQSSAAFTIPIPSSRCVVLFYAEVVHSDGNFYYFWPSPLTQHIEVETYFEQSTLSYTTNTEFIETGGGWYPYNGTYIS